jgi:hypothetical protein
MKPFLSLHALRASATLEVVLAGALLAGLCGCKIQKTGEGASKKVDIETPIGSLHVNAQVDPKDIGLDVYPGATRATDEDSQHAANVSIESSLFGAKVVAIKYRSSDPPDKVLNFYRKQLKAYGEVTECHGSVTFVRGNMLCENKGQSEETNLVAGPEDRRRVVSVKPEGKGSRLALIYVQTRGERGTQ